MRGIRRASDMSHFKRGTRPSVLITKVDIITNLKMIRWRFVRLNKKHNVINFIDIH